MGNTLNSHRDATAASTATVTIQTLGSGLDEHQGYHTADGGADTLASSIAKDMNPQTTGCQTLSLSRLWPGSGRMMRSYRLKVRLARYDNTAASSASSSDSDSLPFTIELSCKSFIVKSAVVTEDSLNKAINDGESELKRLRSLLSNPIKHSHILPYARWIVGSSSTSTTAGNTTIARPIHLLRQHIHSSLADRSVSRPFLTSIEKNWIAYQLLNALQSLHDVDIYHGHVTTENILLTSWNWVLLSDVGCNAFFKPVKLPDDDPGLWIHWFEGRGFHGGCGPRKDDDTVEHHGYGEKKCCLAPERFYSPGKNGKECADGDTDATLDYGGDGDNKLTPAMDIFSLGCVLIELFLNGERALDLGDLMEYRRQGGDVEAGALPSTLRQKLDKIESSKMRAACRHMLSLDPAARLSPNEYLERLSSTKSKKADATDAGTSPPIPPCFKSTLQPFMLRLRTEIQSPDVRISLVACNYSVLLKATVGVEDEWGAAFFSRIIGPTLRRYEGAGTEVESKASSQKPTKGECRGLANLDLNDLLSETEELLRQLDSGSLNIPLVEQNKSVSPSQPLKPSCLLDTTQFPDASTNPTSSQASLIIVLQVILSSIRHVRRTSSKFIGLKLLHRIALFSSDDIRLERIVPFVTCLLQDSEPIIRALAISILTSVLTMVKTFPPSDAQLFPRYVFKKVAHLITDASLIVRVAFARNIATLSETALRFLDIGHAVSLYDAVTGTAMSRDEHSERDKELPVFSEDAANLLGAGVPPEKKLVSEKSSAVNSTTVLIRNTYDSDLGVLHEVVLRWVVHITTDTSDHSSQSKQALLADLPRLCNFFGAEYSFQILPQILAFFNDRRDWQLRASLCRYLPTICVVVGRAATEQFVVPCVESALNDDEEQVVNDALTCLRTLISTGLLTRTSLLGTEAQPPYVHSDGRPRREKQGIIKKAATLLLHPIHSVRQNVASFICFCWNYLGETDTQAFAFQILHPYLQYRPSFETGQHLVSCLKAPTSSFDAANAKRVAPVAPLTSINSEIEYSIKLARSLSVPSQWYNEATLPSLPIWYESLQRVARTDPSLVDPFFALGIKAFEQVYGISIPFAHKSLNQSMITSWVGSNLEEAAKEKSDASALLSRVELKILESSCKGECGSFSIIDQSIPENYLVFSKMRALMVPPLLPSFGLVRSGFDANLNMKQQWRPKEDVLVASTSSSSEHSGPVTKIAVSSDESFFVSASADGTSRVFELGQIKDSGGDLRSCLAYNGHMNAGSNRQSYVRINDITILENSHSVASAASDGSLHIWRVDTVTSSQSSAASQTAKTRVSGNTALKQVYAGEGEIMAVSHFNTSSASILTFATQRGIIHSIDLRSPSEPFSLNFGPQYGFMTSMEVGKDRGWIAAGSNRGYIGLFDIRFPRMIKLWRHSRHSPINCLSNACDVSSWPLLFMGCDNNEATLFDASTGECRQCYRVLEGSLSYIDQAALPLDRLSMPYLESIKVGKASASLRSTLLMNTNRESTFNINALVGKISRNNTSHLITGGSDNMIRYWDIGKSTKSFCVTGLSRNQPPPSFDHMDVGRTSRLYICQQPPVPPLSLLESSRLPIQNRQGVSRCENRHSDSILDLKVVKQPTYGLLSASRDGSIKLWS